ncbi:MAG TPA: LON peptidase substrate-binding domain-containing protein [Burkholderiales bacterium]|nr:LON peptidase substrate-binding domain-containing protein [Burkholderiales bacterium]
MQEFALFPLNTVLFPGGRLPLRIFEQRYMEMATACLRDDTPFGVCLIRDGAEVGAPATPVEIGCLARIAAWDMPQLGMLHIIARGERRFRIVGRRVEPSGLARASIEMLPDDIDAPVPEQCKSCVRLLERVIAQQGEGLFEPPHRFDSSAWVSARLAELLPLPLSAKQELFELTDARARLERLNNLLGR